MTQAAADGRDPAMIRRLQPDHKGRGRRLRAGSRALVGRLPFLVIVLLVSTALAPVTRVSSSVPWLHTGSMVTARIYHSDTLLANGKVLVAGGLGTSNRFLSSAELYDPRTGMWTPTGHMTTARVGHMATLLHSGQVLVAGGIDKSGKTLSSAELYHPHTGHWTPTGRMAVARFNYSATLLPNGQVLVAGGVNASGKAIASAELYHPRTGTWSTTGRMVTARAAHTATLLPNGQVLVVGGFKGAFGAGPVLDSAELYNPATGRWTATGRLITARAFHTATLLPDGRILVAGGMSGQTLASAALVSAEVYDPRTGTWSATGNMNASRFNHTATLLHNAEVLVVGGVEESASGTALASAELYHPRTGIWTMVDSMAAARAGHSATLLPGGDVLVAGGQAGNSSGPPLASAELYNPRAGSSGGPGALPPTDRGLFVATPLPNGMVLVVGGLYGSLRMPATRSSAELYHPRTGRWTMTGNMSVARWDFTATLLPNGKVLVAGGDSGPSAILAGAELYDPRTGRWSATGNMTTPRAGHTATLLATGQVLVTGGIGASGSALASAESYDPRTGRWTKTGRMHTPRLGQTATLLPAGQVLVAGGTSGKPTSILSSAELYDPRTGRWTMTGRMNAPRFDATATRLATGQVLVAGGEGLEFGARTILSSAELYHPRTGRWTATGDMADARAEHTATLLPQGNVLVAGGVGGTGTELSSVELYDPRTGSWTPAGAMAEGRAFHTATRLRSGQVLVAGGISGGLAFSSSAELYHPHTGRWTETGRM